MQREIVGADLIGKVSIALQKTFDPQTSFDERSSCQAFLEELKGHPNSVQIGSFLCSALSATDSSNGGCLSVYLKNYGLLLLEEQVKYKWNFSDQQTKDLIKRELEKLFPLLSTNFVNAIRKKFAQILAFVAVREWPQRWPLFTDFLVSACAQPDNQPGSPLLSQNAGQNCTTNQPLLEMVSFVLVYMTEQLYSPSTTNKFNRDEDLFEEDRRRELHEALRSISVTILPRFSLIFCQLVEGLLSSRPVVLEDRNTQTKKETFSLLTCLLRVFTTCYEWCDVRLFLEQKDWLINLLRLFSLLSGDYSCVSILGDAIELFEVVCEKEYGAEEIELLIPLLQNLSLIFQPLHALHEGEESESKFMFLSIVMSLACFGSRQICHKKYHLLMGKEKELIEGFVELMFKLSEIQAIQVQTAVMPFWVSLLADGGLSFSSSTHTRSNLAMSNLSRWNALFLTKIASRLIQLVLFFSSIELKGYFLSSKKFAGHELSVVDFDRFLSQSISIYAEIIQLVSVKLPDEISMFVLPIFIEFIDGRKSIDSSDSQSKTETLHEWNNERERRAESLVFVVENIVKAFISYFALTKQQSSSIIDEGPKGEFSLLKINEYFVFTLNQLCYEKLTQAESIFFQLSGIWSCVKYVVAFNAPFAFGVLYTKLFHLIYEFSDSNSFYKNRVKEKIYLILNEISHTISPADAETFVRYGLEISKSGYVFPDMNTVLVDFLLNINTDILIRDHVISGGGGGSGERGRLVGQVFELVGEHVAEASASLSVNKVGGLQFLNSVGIYFALKKFTTLKAISNVKFLEGDLKSCSDLTTSISKLNTIIGRVVKRREVIPADYIVKYVGVMLPELYLFIKFLHSLPFVDKSLDRISFVFGAAFGVGKMSGSDRHSLRVQVSQSTLESYLCRFSVWYENIKRASYSLLGLLFDFSSSFLIVDNGGVSDVLRVLFDTIPSIDAIDPHAIGVLLDVLFIKFIKKVPAELLFSSSSSSSKIHLYDKYLREMLICFGEKLFVSWKVIQEEAANEEAKDNSVEEDEDSIANFYLKSVRNSSRSYLTFAHEILDKLRKSTFTERDRVERDINDFIGVFLTALKFEDTASTIKSFELLSRVVQFSNENGLFDVIFVRGFRTLMDSMIRAIIECKDKDLCNSILGCVSGFVVEMMASEKIDFFSICSYEDENDPFLINVKKKFMERKSTKTKKDIIRNFLRNFLMLKGAGKFDGNVDRKIFDRIDQDKKIKNLTEKLVICKDDSKEICRNGYFDEDIGLGLLFE